MRPMNETRYYSPYILVIDQKMYLFKIQNVESIEIQTAMA